MYPPGNGYFPSNTAESVTAQVYAAETTLLAATPGVGVMAIASDTGAAWVGDGTRWLRLPGLGLTTATALGFNHP